MPTPTEEFVAALEGLIETFHKDQRDLFRDWKLTPVQFFVLRFLAKGPARNMSQIAEMLGVRPQTTTAIVDTLEKGGWIRRIPSSTDRRESLLKLTPKAKNQLKRMRKKFVGQLAHVLEQAPARSLQISTEMLRNATETVARERAAPPGAH